MKSGPEFSLALITSLPSLPLVVKPLAVLAQEIWQHSMSLPDNFPADLQTGCLNIDFEACQHDAWQYLSVSETERARRILNKHNAATFVLVHATLRLLLSKRLTIPPGDLVFETGLQGKPALVTGEPLHFNISYRKGIFVIAMGESPVGVDIELHQSDIDTAGIAGRLFSSNEKFFLQQVAGRQEADDQFFKIWSCKEAVVKLFGRSIDDFSRFDAHETLLAIKSSPWSGEKYYCFSLPASPSHALAMAFSFKHDLSMAKI